jgi:hypothetical protein
MQPAFQRAHNQAAVSIISTARIDFDAMPANTTDDS